MTGDQRRCALRGNSWVVPLPRHVRGHLGILKGGDVYWHLGPKGEAHLTHGPTRVGGKPPGTRVARDLADARRQIARLERRLQSRPSVAFNEGVNEGFHLHAGGLVKLGAEIAALRDELRALAARVPFRPRPALPRVTSASRAVAVVGPRSTNTPPPDSSPVVVAGGDAASGGTAPQAAHE